MCTRCGIKGSGAALVEAALMSMCIARDCKNPACADHAECVRPREIDEQRGRRIGL